MNKAQRFFSRLAGFLGLSFLSKDFIQFAKMHSFYGLAVSLSSVFVSTFLLKAGSGFMVVGLYYLCAYSFEGFSNLWVPWLNRRLAPTAISRAGIALSALSYVLLLTLRENVVNMFPAVAIVGAVGSALYWVPYHDYTVRYTHSGNRQTGMSFLGLIWNLIVLITPLISGFITSRLAGMSGYGMIFIISVTSFICGALVSRKLPSEPSGGKGNPLLGLIWEALVKKSVGYMVLAHFFYGIRDGIYMYYLNIVIFDMISSEFVLGLNITVRGVIAIATFFLMGRVLTPKRRISGNFLMLFVSLALSAVMMQWYIAPIVMIVYVLDASLITFINNTLQFCAYDTVDHYARNGENRKTEVISLRNCSLNLGRVAGLFLFLFLPAAEKAVWPIVLLNGIALLSGLFVWLVRRQTEKDRHG